MPWRLDRLASPVGELLLVCDEEEQLRGLDFEENETRIRRLLTSQNGAVDLDPGEAPASIKAPLRAYFDGELTALDAIPIAEVGGTPFQREVWAALRRIRPGSTFSYGALADGIGRPTAVRAVGRANGSNPIALVVPCHRVIGADGSLTGFGGGLRRKRWLLAHEGVQVAND